MSKEKVIEIARGELGVCEEPINRVKYNTAYYGREVSGKNFPWCVTLPWWVFREAGEQRAFFGGGKTASCRTLLLWYQEQGLTADKQDIQVGDILILNFSGKKVGGELDTEHCGLVVEKGPIPGTWYTVEGNTTPGEEGTPQEQADGGCVALKLRSEWNVVGVCRPQYKAEEPDPADDITGHWYTDDVRWCIAQGLIKCYPDGSFRPDQPVTRSEFAVVLRRFYNLIHGEDDLK